MYKTYSIHIRQQFQNVLSIGHAFGLSSVSSGHTQQCLSYGSFDGVKFGQNCHQCGPECFRTPRQQQQQQLPGCFLSHFWTGCIPASSPQISLSRWQLTCLPNRSLRQQDTDIKDRLLRNQCLKCDYNQMCMQIVSASEDFRSITQMHAITTELCVLPSERIRAPSSFCHLARQGWAHQHHSNISALFWEGIASARNSAAWDTAAKIVKYSY